jgi:hypothetical protein
MGSHQETSGGMGCRRGHYNGVGHAFRRATRGTQEPPHRSQYALGHPTTTWESHDGANPSCVISYPRWCSMSNLSSEIRF